MLKINVQNGNIEKALRQYKSKVQKTKMMYEIKSRTEFVSDSEKTRKALSKAVYISKKYQDD